MRVIARWWRKNRLDNETLFEQEFEHALGRLMSMSARGPVGTIYKVVRHATVRRFLLPRTKQHVYYSIDEDTETVIVRTVWGPQRRSGPAGL